MVTVVRNTNYNWVESTKHLPDPGLVLPVGGDGCCFLLMNSL